MKKNIYKYVCALCVALGAFSLSSCSSDDAWGNDNSEMQNVFYFAFQDFGQLKNDVKYTVSQGSTVEIPVQFWCEGTRSFNAEAYYYVDTKLTLGTDFQIVDANGTALQPNSNGAFVMAWDLMSPDTTNNHRVQNIYLKALNGATGSVTVTTFDPTDKGDDGKLRISNGSADGKIYTPNNMNSQYEVHCFTQNYKVTVTIQ